MPLTLCSLNSGSNGNCYYVGNDKDAILVDVGISCRETEHRMASAGLSMDKVKAIFISHEHSDHIKGLEKISQKYNCAIYATAAMFGTLHLKVQSTKQEIYRADRNTEIGSLTIRPFRKHHDAVDPHSFIVSTDQTTIGVFTDIGRICDNLSGYFKLCQAAILEANYDRAMLAESAYSYFLKARISGGKGHLSNDEALDVFLKYKSPLLSHLILGHLSKENNSPETVLNLFGPHAQNLIIAVAGRDRHTAVFKINEKARRIKIPTQLSLFSNEAFT